ncbi:MAG: hypothetical protein LBH25_08385 [Fibromonadaceae bacterium]|nr:hypothetical protein [Fibromonadaceae bacterium]
MKINRFLLATAFAVITFTFFACGSDSPTNGDNNNNAGTNLYCDFGPVTQYGGGCFEISDASDCDTQWGSVVNACSNNGNTPPPPPSSSSVSPQPTPSSSSVSNISFFTDTRDNKNYITVVIGTQTWMAQNLNYTPTSGSSKCPNNTAANCATYGRQYDWATAMGLVSSYNTTLYNMANTKHKGVCPTGWHLPSKSEWETLVIYVGTNPGTKLKATSGWPGSNANGTDNYSFAALPGGYVEYGAVLDSYRDIGTSGLWWTASEYSANYAYDKMMGSSTDNYTGVYNYGNASNDYSWTKRDMLSVRCVKD